jgi:hypothetical protein
MPADTKTNTEPYENLTSSHGPRAPERESRRPEDNYPAGERKTGVNPTGPGAPRGPVNIPVKGGAEPAGPDAAVKETPQATGKGSRDAPSLPQD